MGISSSNAVRQNGLVAPTTATQATQASVDTQSQTPGASSTSSAQAAPSVTPATAQTASSTPTAAAQAPKSGGGLFGFVADIFIGGGQAAWDMVKGVGTMVTHPIKTVEGLGYAVTHPAALVHAFVDPFAQAVAEGRPGLALGMGIVDIGTFFIPGVGFGGASADATGAAGALAATAGTVAGDAGKVAEVAGKAGAVAGDAGKVAAVAGKAGAVAGDAGKVAAIAGKAGAVAGDAGKVAAVAGKAGKVAETAGDASKVAEAAGKAANFAARLADKPILTRAAEAALKDAGISSKVGKTALAAAHSTYWDARAAGMSAKAAETAAASKAADIMGLAQDSTAAVKVASGARLAGAAADAGKWFTRTNYVERPLVTGAKVVGGTIDKGIVATVQTGKVVADVAEATATKIGTAVSELGDITLGQIAMAPIVLAEDAGKVVVDAGKAVAVGVNRAVDALGNVTLGDVVMAPVTAVKAGAAAIGRAADAIGGMSVGDILSGAIRLPGTIAKAALANPASLVRPIAVLGIANNIGQGALALAGAAPANSGNPSATPGTSSSTAPTSLSNQQVQQIATKYGLQPTAQNVGNFVKEVQSYAKNAIGPDSGTADQVKQLQTVLRALGYDVTPSGTFDNTTAAAVIDFKKQHGIHQTYNMADGTPATNEYVDPTTAQAMVDALKQGWKAGSSASSGSPTSTTSGSTSGSTVGSASTSTASGTASVTPTASPAPSVPTPGSTSSSPAGSSSSSTASSTASATPTAPTIPTTASTASVAANLPALTYTVTAADRQGGLWGIAARFLGSASKWPEIYALNKDVIGPDPNVIHMGQVLKMPPGSTNLPSTAAPAQTPTTAPAAGSAPVTPAAAPVTPAAAPVTPAAVPATPAAVPATPAASPAPASSPASPQLTDAQVAQLVKQYGLASDRANVEAFASEVASYPSSAIGPDVGTKSDITKLQQVLIQLGFTTVKANGTFDTATADAVIAFKQKHGLHQTYKLANGDWAINEYVDVATASTMANTLSVNPGH